NARQPRDRYLIRLNARIDICVILLKKRHDKIVRVIVKELWPPVTKSFLVLASFQDEFISTAEPVTLSEVFCHAADKKIRPLPRGLENPSQHGSSGRFSVRTAHHNRMLSRQKNLFQHLRQ